MIEIVPRLTRSFVAVSLILSPFVLHAELYSAPDLVGKEYVEETPKDQGAWVMGYANYTRQKAQDFTPGYNAKTFGGGFGVDYRLNDPWMVGFGMRFDNTKLESTNFIGTNLDFTSTRFLAYTRYDFNDRWFINGLVGYGFNEYNTQRYVYTFLAPGTFANIIDAIGDIDGRQWNVELNTGYQFSYDKWQLLPSINVDYTHLALEDYAEKSAGLANRRFDKRDLDSLRFSADITIAYQNEFPLAQLMPYVHFRATYDTETDLVFTGDVFGGGTAFASFGPTPPHTSYQAGTGFTLFGQGNIQVTMRYDYTFKHHYRDHGGVMYVRHEW